MNGAIWAITIHEPCQVGFHAVVEAYFRIMVGGRAPLADSKVRKLSPICLRLFVHEIRWAALTHSFRVATITDLLSQGEVPIAPALLTFATPTLGVGPRCLREVSANIL